MGGGSEPVLRSRRDGLPLSDRKTVRLSDRGGSAAHRPTVRLSDRPTGASAASRFALTT